MLILEVLEILRIVGKQVFFNISCKRREPFYGILPNAHRHKKVRQYTRSRLDSWNCPGAQKYITSQAKYIKVNKYLK